MSRDLTIRDRPPPENFPALVMRVDGLLELWTGDLRGMPTDALERLRADGDAAVRPGGMAEWLAGIMREAATDEEIGLALMNLVGSFPQSKETDLSTFGLNITGDVRAARPGRVALEAACSHLRKTRDFLPSIRLVLEAIAEKQAACNTRADLLDRLAPRVALAGEILKGRPGG